MFQNCGKVGKRPSSYQKMEQQGQEIVDSTLGTSRCDQRLRNSRLQRQGWNVAKLRLAV